MGFALWMEEDVAWAQGTHEYRPMGAAVIGSRTLFAARDFRPALRAPSRNHSAYVGLFASIGEMNEYLYRRRSQASPRMAPKRIPRTFPVI
jgi:hypothetical protein